MSQLRVVGFTALAMVAFAANSLLCRLALKGHHIDAASFTAVRVVSGAVTLTGINMLRADSRVTGGSWLSALALFCYAAAFSVAYLVLSAGTGALLLFGAVQATMIGAGMRKGERLHLQEMCGLLLAFAGFGALCAPGLNAPSPLGAILMVAAGISWGIYSVRGRSSGDPTRVTADNFRRAVPMAIAVSLLLYGRESADLAGLACAIASGTIASGLGYAIWYAVLPHLKAITSSIVQLSVPVITATAGDLLLTETVTLRFELAAAAVLGGIALVVVRPAAR